ncbi:hypothetical protein B0H14DRAFT_3453855 [Mycena olivaceomarginata]|nr:hypothetical protein B0H14DRAFT_3453855 [Mycena olivaceomarginata]
MRIYGTIHAFACSRDPGHFLALTKGGGISDAICFTPYTLAAARFPRDRYSSAISRPNRPSLLHQTAYPVIPGRSTPFMSVHDCPLNRGSHFVATSTRRLPVDRKESRQRSHRFRLTFNPTSACAPPTWELNFGVGTIDCELVDTFTYAGYGRSLSPFSRDGWSARHLSYDHG